MTFFPKGLQHYQIRFVSFIKIFPQQLVFSISPRARPQFIPRLFKQETSMGLLDASHSSYRFIVLFFNCMLTFGSYFCFDMPSALQKHIQQPRLACNESRLNVTANYTNFTANNNVTAECCDDCLELNATNYNLLYAIYSWTNAVIVIFAGFLIDKMGNSIGLCLFSSLCLVGSVIFTVSNGCSVRIVAIF